MMKTITVIRSLFLIAIFIVNVKCNKEITRNVISIAQPPPPSVINIAASVSAGQDKYVFLPANNCKLIGYTINNWNNIDSIQWNKIAGPVSYHIENPNSLITNVINLERGIYEFELMITLSGGLKSKDTCKVIVGEISSNPTTIILQNQIWIFPWYNTIRIQNFNSLVPPQLLRKIYIKRDGNPDWIEVDYDFNNYLNGGLYFYSLDAINNGTLDIYYFGSDVSDTPDVKILF